jgi:hypothetical protein
MGAAGIAWAAEAMPSPAARAMEIKSFMLFLHWGVNSNHNARSLNAP